MVQSITTLKLEELLSSNDVFLLDVRPSAAFNGWQLQNEARGGHIPGAVSFPQEWFDDLGNEEAVKKLMEKGITKEKSIIVTGYGQSDIKTAVNHLEEIGFSKIQIHSEGMPGWASELQLPLKHLQRYRHLVHPDWLKQLLDGKNPEPNNINRFILAHVNFDNWGDYDEGHIPGSIWLDTLILEDEDDWNCRTPEELEEELKAHGITRDTIVVLYGRTGNPDMSQDQPGKEAGQIASMRAASLLMYAGVKDVRVLDGGLDAWLRSGGTITKEETLPTPVEKTGLIIPEHPEYIVDIKEAKQMLADPNSELVSIRSWYEFTGKVSGYHYVQHAGRIPGAVFGDCGSDAYHMENYRNHDDTMRSFEEITASWRESSITPDKHIAFYCGTGWRASEAFFCAWLMGWDRVAVFDGGWYEWSADPDNPVETGIPQSLSPST
jgi:thiosulfate/3-mercaptopyruvate sulfurtransferase